MEFGRVDVERKEEASLVSSQLEASQRSGTGLSLVQLHYRLDSFWATPGSLTLVLQVSECFPFFILSCRFHQYSCVVRPTDQEMTVVGKSLYCCGLDIYVSPSTLG